VTGWQKTILALLIIISALSIPSAFFLASPSQARAASLDARLTHTRRELRHARMALRHDRLAYAAALAATSAAPSAAPTTSAALPAAVPAGAAAASPLPVPATASAANLVRLLRAVRGEQHRVRALTTLVGRLRHELVLRRAAAHGDWMPIVREAAHRNRISATGLRRLMSLESGGRAHAENGSFHGLYQYCWSTWRAAWNPWRGSSLYDGEAQIRATALAIRRGMGRQMWPNTYSRAF
jgi:hypothetical protein